ncbi:hypothetical protein DQ384_37450 [Sphaerisporangium album]|uniref:Uncharacterized protein n=1 Tax=Sphaerisporangium album TaxID=509200 RepID=A0A367EQ27_9ACTN|nr:hypothetical protein [Sphaerisporangium album]RCG20194.1 hypothetical protein DQ384_37450 [Sphaerisporangium album]
MVWEEDYTVRHLTDRHGNAVEVWSLAGVLVQPPWSGTWCPGCGDIDVKIFPRGYLSRHPEIRLTSTRATLPLPEPVAGGEPIMAAPEPPAVPPAAATRRSLVPPRHPVLYALAGLSVLLVAGLELLQLLRAAHPVH